MEFLQDAFSKRPIILNGKNEYSEMSSAISMYNKYKDQPIDSNIAEDTYDNCINATELYIYEYYSGLEIKIVNDNQNLEFVLVINGEELEYMMEIFASVLPELEKLKIFGYTTRFMSEVDYSCFSIRPENLEYIKISNLMSVPPSFINGIHNLEIDEYFGNETIPKSVNYLIIHFWSEMDDLALNDLQMMIDHLKTFSLQFPELEYFEVNQINIFSD